MRRRLRRQRRVREALLLDLGALVYELHRQGRRAPELLQEKAGKLSEVDEEVRGLEHALGDGHEPEPEPGEETAEWAAADTGEWPSEAEEPYEGEEAQYASEEEPYEGEEDGYDEPYEGEDEDLGEFEDLGEDEDQGEDEDHDHEGAVHKDNDESEPAAPDDETRRP